MSVIVIIIVGITNSTTTIAVDVFEVILFMIILFDLIIKVGVVGPKRVWSLEWFKYDLIIEFFILLFGFISAPLFGNINSLRVVFRLIFTYDIYYYHYYYFINFFFNIY